MNPETSKAATLRRTTSNVAAAKKVAKSSLEAVVPAYIPRARDAIMQELWDVKARLNAEAGYSAANIVARVRASEAARGIS